MHIEINEIYFMSPMKLSLSLSLPHPFRAFPTPSALLLLCCVGYLSVKGNKSDKLLVPSWESIK